MTSVADPLDVDRHDVEAVLAELGPAGGCVLHHAHKVKVHEYAWHHVWPVGLGGPLRPTDTDGLVGVCPTGHANVHVALRVLLAAWLAGTPLADSALIGWAWLERDYARLGLRRVADHYATLDAAGQAAYRAQVERFLGHRPPADA